MILRNVIFGYRDLWFSNGVVIYRWLVYTHTHTLTGGGVVDSVSPFFSNFISSIPLFIYFLAVVLVSSFSSTAGKRKKGKPQSEIDIWRNKTLKRFRFYSPLFRILFEHLLEADGFVAGPNLLGPVLQSNDDFLLGFRVSPVNIFHSLSRGICLHYFFGFAVVVVKSLGACQNEWIFRLRDDDGANLTEITYETSAFVDLDVLPLSILLYSDRTDPKNSGVKFSLPTT